MDIQGYFTKKGLLLAAKLAAGSTLKITRVCAGAAETALTASALSQIRQTLPVGRARRTGDTAVLPVTLEAGSAGSVYTLRELGVYAQDPDEGEILYKLYRLSDPVEIRPSSRLVLRFYLEETVSQDLNVTVVRASAGLLTEADLEPAWNKIEAVSVPWRTVELAASELPGFLASLPRLLTEQLVIRTTGNLNAGECLLEGFYGCGALHIVQMDGGAVFRTCMRADRCGVPVELQNIRFEDPVPGAEASRNGLFSVHGSAVYAYRCSFTSSNGGTAHNHGYRGISVGYGSAIYAEDCSFQNCGVAALATGGGIAVCTKRAESTTVQDNAIGAYVYDGGMIVLAGTMPDTLGGAYNGKLGGLIVKSDGTPL